MFVPISRPETMERITTPELAEKFIAEQVEALRAQIGGGKVLLALSGGVDSSVVAALLIKAVGKQLVCVHVNHGLLRKGEPEQVIEVFRNQMDANLIYVDAVDRFLDKLAGVSAPEQKRHIIGEEFIDVFADEARKLDGVSFLAQGTIWPDILESEAGIKAHHNAGGLPEDIASRFELVEPVRILFKDEVRVARVRRDPPRGVREGRSRRQGLAVLHRRARLYLHRHHRRQAHRRLARHHPRREHPRRHDRHGRAPRLGAARSVDRPHHERGQGRQPRALRLHAQADRHDRIRIISKSPGDVENTQFLSC